MKTPVLPYVYKGTNLETKEFYIGSRWVNTVPAEEDFGFHYFTSSKIVEPIFDQFQWEIIAEFATGDEAYDHEQLLIFESWEVEGLLNKSCFHGMERFRTSGPLSEEHKGRCQRHIKVNHLLMNIRLRYQKRLKVKSMECMVKIDLAKIIRCIINIIHLKHVKRCQRLIRIYQN